MITAEEQRAHRQLWISRLRDGAFLQGEGCLRKKDPDGDLHCCLGVACEIYRQETGLGGWQSHIRDSQHTDYLFILNGEGYATALPTSVAQWYGLKTTSGGYSEGNYIPRSLVGANDRGARFPAIADIIEAEPTGLVALETS